MQPGGQRERGCEVCEQSVQGAWATRQEDAVRETSLVARGAEPQQRVSFDPRLGGWGASVAESVLAPPGPIPNPVVTQCSAGEY